MNSKTLPIRRHGSSAEIKRLNETRVRQILLNLQLFVLDSGLVPDRDTIRRQGNK